MSYKKGLGFPYMGSKRKIAKEIVDKILEIRPNTKYVYDLFGGGGAITLEFIQRPQIEKVYYNDTYKPIVDLFERVWNSGVTNDMYQWVSRENYNKHRYCGTWYEGFLGCVWSFGNNIKKGYLYGKDIEEYKRWLHEIIVNKDEILLDKFERQFKIKIDKDYLFSLDELNERRLYLMKIIKENKNRFDIENIDRIIQLERIDKLQHLTSSIVLNVKTSNKEIVFSSKSYKDIIIETSKEETIIYLDPPYRNTTKYKESIDYKELDDWIKNNKYDVFMSEYEAPFNIVWKKKKRVIMNSKDNTKLNTEKLYYNRKE